MPSRRATFAAITALTVVVAVIAALMLPFTAHAAWPDKPVRIVVTFAAGGAIGGLDVVRAAPDRGPAITAADIKP